MRNILLAILLMACSPLCKAQERAQEGYLIPYNEVLKVAINLKGQLWMTYENWEGDGDSHYITFQQLHDITKAFIQNKDKKSNWPSHEPVNFMRKEFRDKGVESTVSHIIWVQSDREAPRKAVERVNEVLLGVYDELRDEYAVAKFGKSYKALSKREQEFVYEVYPERLVESKPLLLKELLLPPPALAPTTRK